jgi:hypothetical protein
MKNYPSRPLNRTVDLHHDHWDKMVYELASLGWTTEAIGLETGFTDSQIAYRIKRFEIKRREYRNGGKLAVELFKMVHKQNLLKASIQKRADKLEKRLDRKGGVR